MTEPATEEDIERWSQSASQHGDYSDRRILSLIARIRSEQENALMMGSQLVDAYEATQAAEALASSIREKTIRECSVIAETYTNARFIRSEILALLEQKP